MLAVCSYPTPAARQLGEAIRHSVDDGELAASIWQAFRSRPTAPVAAPAAPPQAPRPAPCAAALALAHDLHCLAALSGRDGGSWARSWLTPTRLAWARQLGDWPGVCARAAAGPRALVAALQACAPAGAHSPPVRPAAALELGALWRRYVALTGAERPTMSMYPRAQRSLGAWHLAAARAVAEPGPAPAGAQLMAWVRRCPPAHSYAA